MIVVRIDDHYSLFLYSKINNYLLSYYEEDRPAVAIIAMQLLNFNRESVSRSGVCCRVRHLLHNLDRKPPSHLEWPKAHHKFWHVPSYRLHVAWGSSHHWAGIFLLHLVHFLDVSKCCDFLLYRPSPLCRSLVAGIVSRK